MNTNWSKILVFGLLFGIAGFFIGRCSGKGCGPDRGACHKPMACCDKDGNCEHGGTCCKPGGQCDKQGCDHAAMMEGHGKACCKGGHGHGHRAGQHPADSEAEAFVQRLKEAGFEGDTTLTIAGGTVNVVRKGDHTEVRVNVQDSVKKEVNAQVEHTH
ncbi:MAG: hypothetical protein JNM62_08955 [Flavobacteriales bacterium]|nr:hypothetical protein [Flavobacteriales bacterium]